MQTQRSHEHTHTNRLAHTLRTNIMQIKYLLMQIQTQIQTQSRIKCCRSGAWNRGGGDCYVAAEAVLRRSSCESECLHNPLIHTYIHVHTLHRDARKFDSWHRDESRLDARLECWVSSLESQPAHVWVGSRICACPEWAQRRITCVRRPHNTNNTNNTNKNNGNTTKSNKAEKLTKQEIMFKDIKDMPTPVDICTVFGVRSLLLAQLSRPVPPSSPVRPGQPVCGIASWSKMGSAAFPFRKTRLPQSVLPQLASWPRRPTAYRSICVLPLPLPLPRPLSSLDFCFASVASSSKR